VGYVFALFLHLEKTDRGMIICALVRDFRVDLVAQLVEHNTFNVGVLGSSPSGITDEGSDR
jgi:hypothetical protein